MFIGDWSAAEIPEGNRACEIREANSMPLVFVIKVVQLSTKVMHSQIEKINV
jgi:hypothetical protein